MFDKIIKYYVSRDISRATLLTRHSVCMHDGQSIPTNINAAI